MTRRNRMNRTLQTRAALVSRFPEVFRGKNQPKIPLAVGISEAILREMPEMPPKHLREALADYANGPRYLIALKPGAQRFDLDGSPAGTVTEGEAEHADRQLKALNRIWDAQKNGARNKSARGEAVQQAQQEETEAGVRLTPAQSAAARMDGGHRGL